MFAAGQIDHRAGIAYVPEAPCAGFHILDDASWTPEGRVGVPVAEVDVVSSDGVAAVPTPS